MSKAIAGIAELGGALAIGVTMFALASTGAGFAAMPFLMHAMEALAVAGISTEAAAAATALTQNRGVGITVRQTAGNRQIIRGTRRVGGVMIFRSTTGGSKNQLNYVIVLSGQEVWAITDLYLDGRKVYWQGSGAGWQVRNGYGFGGIADNNNHEGPNGVQYNFGGTGHSGLYCEARYGDQAVGDVIGGLTANDPSWAPGANGSPFVGGCAYFYLKIESNSTLFPTEPEIRITVMGKPVFDPRTGETTYTDNWALHVADHIADPEFGLGDPYVNEAQLIAAANVCDEQIPLAAGGTESQWCLHWNYDTTMSPGNTLVAMMEAAGGRVRQIGGEWWIFPAYWQGPSASYDHGSICGRIDWNPNAGIDQLCNTVTGTYIAPNYPYNVAGNLYDSNGFYEGQTQNNFPFAYQPTNFPQYARDTAHGYASNEDLITDSGAQGAYSASQTYNEGDVVTYNGAIWVSLQDASLGNTPAAATGTQNPNKMPWGNGSRYLPMDMQLQTVCSVGQAQRLAKLKVMRSRYYGSGQFPMMLNAYQSQSLDVVEMTVPELGWNGKVLELDMPTVRSVATRRYDDGSEGEPALQIMWNVAETNPSIYEWSPTEEQTVYAVSATPVNTAVLQGAQYLPSTFTDTGTQPTQNPGDAYNGNGEADSIVSGTASTTAQTAGNFSLAGFPAVSLGSDATLFVEASAAFTGAGTAGISATYQGSAALQMASLTATSGTQLYTLDVPAGTVLSTLSVNFTATPTTPTSGTSSVALSIASVYLQS